MWSSGDSYRAQKVKTVQVYILQQPLSKSHTHTHIRTGGLFLEYLLVNLGEVTTLRLIPIYRCPVDGLQVVKMLLAVG